MDEGGPSYNYNAVQPPIYSEQPPINPAMMPQQIPMTGQQLDTASLQGKMESFVNGVVVKQKISLTEALTGCDMPNVYEVWKKDQANQKTKHRQFKYKEKSSCCDRCLQGSCRPFKMIVTNNRKDSDDDDICMRIIKECKCAYYCFNRGEMDCYLTDKADGGEYLGKCFDPWECCHFIFNIFGPEKEVVYTIKADCCQLYFWCGCPCDNCQKVVFEIHEGDQNGPVVGNLNKIGKGCCKNCCALDQASNF